VKAKSMHEPEPSSEFTLINWFRQRERSRPGRGTTLGIGDDCAILGVTPGCDLLVTTDMLMDGRHFRLDQYGPEAVGYKAMGVNLSDIAAMAGVPRAGVVAVALPRLDAIAVAQGVYNGMRSLAEQFQVELVGGDTNAWDGPLVINVTLVGETTSLGPVRRSGARAGDIILVTGALGGSLASGRHLRPEPRIAEALALHAAAPIHAMIDISDGLSSDLGHILEESGVGAVVDAESIPIHPDCQAMSRQDGVPALDHAVNDGEDFELCLVVSAENAARLLASTPSPAKIYSIGAITDAPGLRLKLPDGRIVTVGPGGFDHLRATK
ncbi:MAG TPA: thiamine-phosphate kinase, partial [Isosphaeraceae bacterium]|nr:thiamine-phosphate kinase [Isosphaeraceae bacterium]